MDHREFLALPRTCLFLTLAAIHVSFVQLFNAFCSNLTLFASFHYIPLLFHPFYSLKWCCLFNPSPKEVVKLGRLCITRRRQPPNAHQARMLHLLLFPQPWSIIIIFMASHNDTNSHEVSDLLTRLSFCLRKTIRATTRRRPWIQGTIFRLAIIERRYAFRNKLECILKLY